MKMKICSKCNIEKNLTDFHKEKKGKQGRRGECKICRNAYKCKYDKEHAERHQKYYVDNKEHIVECHKQWRIDNKEYYIEYAKHYRKDNPEKFKKYDVKHGAIRRGFGTPTAINEKFEGSEEHHLHILNEETGIIDTQTTINIPSELHQSVWHSRHRPDLMLVINELAMEWYYEQEINYANK